MTVTVPETPALVTIPQVELIQAGQWDASTGRVTFTVDDLAAAVGALDCPAIRNPVISLGHSDPRFSGEPAVGWIDNMALTEDGHTIVGDYRGLPAWLGDVIASAFPDRSIEGDFDWRCQLGHTHPFVIHAVALLGVARPGVGTLESLQDIAALYGVAATEADQSQATRVTLTIHQEAPVPNPRPAQVAASVSSEDVRRAYYESAPWSVWIEEMQLDPLQLIVIDDENGQRSRVPVVVDGAKDGEDAVTFGTAVPVVVRYEDKPTEPVAASAAEKGHIRFASKAESRPDAPKAPVATSAGGSTPHEGSESMTDLATAVRQKLGIADENADEATLLAALDEALAERAETTEETTEEETKPVVPVLPDGVVVIDKEQLEELQVAAKAGASASERFARDDRDGAIKAAIGDGRIPKARQEHYEKAWAADAEGTKTLLASLAKGLVPVSQIGTAAGGEDAGDSELDQISASITRLPLKVS